MKSIANKTQRPVSVPLPRGKTLHLGPGKTGQISSEAAEHAGLKKLVEGGTIEILEEGARPLEGTAGERRGAAGMFGQSRGRGGRRSGDR
jgi:hypothetical protein